MFGYELHAGTPPEEIPPIYLCEEHGRGRYLVVPFLKQLSPNINELDEINMETDIIEVIYSRYRLGVDYNHRMIRKIW